MLTEHGLYFNLYYHLEFLFAYFLHYYNKKDLTKAVLCGCSAFANDLIQ
jgi:hypothetical protein